MTYILPGVVSRTELTGYILGATPVVDGFYSMMHRLRELRYSATTHRLSTEAECFYHWIRSRKLSTARLRSDQVIAFQAKYGTLAPFLSELQYAVARGLTKGEWKDFHEAFAGELDRRVKHAKKVLSKGHDIKAFYLTGLFSTLGGLIGGVPGAFLGGIGGRIITQLALEYDRNIPGELSFIAEVID